MKTLIVLSIFISTTSFSFYNPKNLYVVPIENFILLSPFDQPPMLDRKENLLLIEMDFITHEKLLNLTHKIHTVCGGVVGLESRDEWDNGDVVNNKSIINPPEYGEPKFENEVFETINHLTEVQFGDQLTKITNFPDRYAKSKTGVEFPSWVQTQFENWDKERVSFRYVTPLQFPQQTLFVNIKGEDSSLDAIVIGAHIDTYLGQKPGADDDGSGVAAIMEVGRVILEQKLHFKRDVYFAFYSAEEWGLYGSKKLVGTLKNEGFKAHAVMQLDMIGFNSPNDLGEMFFIKDYTYDPLTEYTKKLAQKYLGLKVLTDDQCGYACSDHHSWFNNGYPVVFPFEASFKYYNKSLHTSEDTISKLDLKYALQFVKLAASFVVELAEPGDNK